MWSSLYYGVVRKLVLSFLRNYRALFLIGKGGPTSVSEIHPRSLALTGEALKSLGPGVSVLMVLILGQVFQNDHLLICSWWSIQKSSAHNILTYEISICSVLMPRLNNFRCPLPFCLKSWEGRFPLLTRHYVKPESCQSKIQAYFFV